MRLSDHEKSKRRSCGRPKGSLDKTPRKPRGDRSPIGPPPPGQILCRPAEAQAIGGWGRTDFNGNILPRLQSFKRGRARIIVTASVYAVIAEQIEEARQRGELIEPRLKIDKSAATAGAGNAQK